jgi:probable HAF family extracellular repeat protein
MTSSPRLRRLGGVICAALSASAIMIGGTIPARAAGPTDGHAFLYSGGVMIALGTLPGDSMSFADGINSQGQVVGGSGTSLAGRAFLWTAQSGMVDLNTVLPANSGWILDADATGINDSGQITGTGTLNGARLHGYILTLPAAGRSASIIDIGVMPGGSFASPFAINSSGQVVGQGDTTNPNGGTFTRAFLYSAGTMTSLGALTVQGDSMGTDINDGGEVAGTSEVNFTDSHAFLYTQGAMLDLGAGQGLGINNTGQVVGSNAAGHAALYSAATMTDLGTLPGGAVSEASGINLAGKIVGFSETGNSTDHAVVFGGGTVTDIGTLPGFDNSMATRVNAAGQIIGWSWSGALNTDTDLGLTGVPANITVNATGQSGAVVTYSAPTAVDEAGDSPAPTVSCTPDSGSTFVIGTTTVTCTASDADDTPSTVSGTFTVTVNDTDLGLAGLPANITVNATSPSGAAVNYSAPTALDEAGDSPAPTVSCTPGSGSTFVIGTTTVTCTATSADDTPSTVSGTFTVTVNDTDLGLTGLPANITVNATSPSGAAVTYSAPTAVDEAGDSPAPTVSCTPGSGSTFVIGTTTVTCTATSADDTPGTVSGTFTVTVTVSTTAASIKADVNQFLASGMIKNAGLANSLLAKLNAASAARASGDCAGAAASYQAFINELQAQSGKGVATVAASALIAEAQFLIANCP